VSRLSDGLLATLGWRRLRLKWRRNPHGAPAPPALADRQNVAAFQSAKERVPMRTLHDHQVNPANDKLSIEVMDEPGAGGACHHYQISGFNTATNPSDPFVERHGGPAEHSTILFQNGPINEAGINGVTHEVLLAILADRLRAFQAGPYACRENALALTKIEEAQHWLHHRTQARMHRGVEGTHTV
jgi:hypothetical protein